MTDVMLQGNELSYAVGDAELVSDASITVRPGEVVAVLGPNGAGKSTLLSLLAGDTEPTAGEVALAGVPMRDLEPGQRATLRAVLPQHVYPDVPYTAQAVVAMGRFPHRRSEGNSNEHDIAAVAKAMEATDSAFLGPRIFATLSGGEQTRVALARVIAQATPLLLLDEPTKALDLGHQEQMLRMIRSRADAGQAVVVVLHDLNAAATHADRVALMAEGRIVGDAPPADLFDEKLLTEIYNEPMRVLPHPLRPGPLVLPG